MTARGWFDWERVLRLGRPESADVYVVRQERRWFWSVRVEGRTVRRGSARSRRSARNAAGKAASAALGLP